MAQSLEGIGEVRFDDRTDLLTVEYDPATLREEAIRDFISKFGYGVMETEVEGMASKSGIANTILIGLAVAVILLLIWWMERL